MLLSHPIVRRLRSGAVGFAFLAPFPTIVAAQAQPTAPRAFCIRGHPLPICQRFLLLEFGGSGLAFTTHKVPRDQVNVAEIGDAFGSLDVGGMVNRLNGAAIGGSIQIGAWDSSRRRLAVEARHRTWLNSAVAIDLGAGPLEINTQRSFRPFANGAGYGVTSHAGLVLLDLITVTTGVDVVRGQRTQFTMTFGGRLGSIPVAGLAVLVGTLVAGYHDPS